MAVTKQVPERTIETHCNVLYGKPTFSGSYIRVDLILDKLDAVETTDEIL